MARAQGGGAGGANDGRQGKYDAQRSGTGAHGGSRVARGRPCAQAVTASCEPGRRLCRPHSPRHQDGRHGGPLRGADVRDRPDGILLTHPGVERHAQAPGSGGRLSMSSVATASAPVPQALPRPPPAPVLPVLPAPLCFLDSVSTGSCTWQGPAVLP